MKPVQLYAFDLDLPERFALALLEGRPEALSVSDQSALEAVLRQLYGELGRLQSCRMGAEAWQGTFNGHVRTLATFTFTFYAEVA